MDMSTKKSRLARQRYGVTGSALGGLVSALAIDETSGILAAGTYQRQMQLFENQGSGQDITAFSLTNSADAEEKEWGVNGAGVTQIWWSGNGRYLIVGERQSDGLLVYDIRVTGKRLSWLKGRKANIPLKCAFDVVDVPREGVDVWAGGTDGMVRIWKNVTTKEGVVEHDDEFRASTGDVPPLLLSSRQLSDLLTCLDTVSSVMLHPTAPIFATTSGQRLPSAHSLHLDSDSDSDSDSDGDSDSDSDSGDATDTPSPSTSRSQRGPSTHSTSRSTLSETRAQDNAFKVWATSDVYPSVQAHPP